MKILVTGGAGFIGSNIVDAYIELGHTVTIIDNLSTGRRQNINPKADFHELDIRKPSLEDVFRNDSFDVITHLAAQIDVRKSVTQPVLDADINVLGGIHLLMMAHKYGVKKVIYSSTGGAIYGEPKYLPCDENHPIRPMAGYGVSKHVLEHYIELYADLFKLDYTIGSGKHTRYFVYVGDVVQANVLALNSGSGQIINIGTGVETSVNEILETMTSITGFKGEARYEEERLGEVFRIYLDVKKAGEMLGWKPQVMLHEGMEKTIEYTRKTAQVR